MFLYPPDSLKLIIESEVAVAVIFLFDLFMAEVAQNTDSVIGKDRYDPSLCQFISSERILCIRTGIKSASMEKTTTGQFKAFLGV